MPASARADQFENSLWEATAVPAPAAATLDRSIAVDCAIIGGGYTGLSAALRLAEQGARVALLEAGAIGAGASGRNGGQINPGLRLDPDDLIARFGEASGRRAIAVSGAAPDAVFALIDRHGIDCGATRPGWLQLAHSEATLDKLKRRAEQWSRHGVAIKMLDGPAVATMVGTQRYHGGLVDPRGGLLNPLSYARGLARAAIGAGAQIFINAPVAALRHQGGSWQAVTAMGAVQADRVIIATNAYSDDLWPGLRRSVLPIRTFQVATAPLDRQVSASILPGGHGVSDMRRLILYFRKGPGDRLIMGGRASSTERVNPGLFRFLRGVVAGMFPQLGAPSFEFSWSGKVALTLDSLPHIHELAPGVVAALGYNGRGVAMATVTGQAVADHARGADANHLPLPVTDMRRIPLHGLRQPVLHLAMQYHRLMDWLGR